MKDFRALPEPGENRLQSQIHVLHCLGALCESTLIVVIAR